MALNKPTMSSSYQTLATPNFQAIPDLAVDGKAEPDINQKTCFLSADSGDLTPFWLVDLEQTYVVHLVTITNRGDCCGK
nr:hypothetical protein BaRGS_022325 [Batillaria attramentaria]